MTRRKYGLEARKTSVFVNTAPQTNGENSVNNLTTIDAAAQTMTSLEISEVVKSNHADVRRSIERLAERGVITLQPLAEVSNPGPGPKTVKVYHVNKRDSYVIVAQLSPEFTAALVDPNGATSPGVQGGEDVNDLNAAPVGAGLA